MSVYHSQIPGGAPPATAQPVSGEIWRGVKHPPLSAAAFLSEAELGSPRVDPTVVQAWGLSVWRSKEAVDHALKVFRHMRKWQVAKGEPTQDKGVILDTSTNRQPEHYTWWKPMAYDPTPDFSVMIGPSAT